MRRLFPQTFALIRKLYSTDVQSKVLNHVSRIEKAQNDATFCALKVWSCNATGGIQFPEAYMRFGPVGQDIKGKHIDRQCAFEAWKSTKGRIKAGTVLETALQKLKLMEAVLSQNNLDGKLMSDALKCLQNFEENLENTKKTQKKLFQMIKSTSCESKLQALISTHIISQLIPNGEESYKINGQGFTKNYKTCPCGCRKPLQIGYTGLGNQEVWFGYPDITTNRCTVMVETHVDHTESESEDRKLLEENMDIEEILTNLESMKSEEIKNKFSTENINDNKLFGQFIAQTITNAFYQSTLSPELGDYLVPSFLFTNSKIYICMYSVNTDLLLMRWPPLELWDTIHRTIDMETIFKLWMTLNFDILCGPVTENVLQLVEKYDLKSNFPNVIEKDEPGSYDLFKYEIDSPIKTDWGDVWGNLNLYSFAEED